MITKHRLIKAFSSIALIVCFAHASPKAHAQSYILTDLGMLAGQKDGLSTPAAINAKGKVAGTSGTFAFRYDESRKEKMENVGTIPAGSISRGFGINDSDQVVGDSTFGGGVDVISIVPPPLLEHNSHAAIFEKGSAADLGTLQKGSEYYSRANSINASGQVVGFSGLDFDGNQSRAFIWSAPTGMLDLGTLGGAHAQAMAINDAGYVTGNSEVSDNAAVAVAQIHAFRYQPLSATQGLTKQMQDLGTLGGDSSYAMFINASNHVVGYSKIGKSDGRFHAFLHDGAKMLDLGSLGGKSVATDQSFAMGVNATDQVVGYTYLAAEAPGGWVGVVPGPVPALTQVAFVYNQGKMVDLNGLIGSAAKTYRLYSATAINDNGEIVANAFDSSTNAFHAVLLTPDVVGPVKQGKARPDLRNQIKIDRVGPVKR